MRTYVRTYARTLSCLAIRATAASAARAADLRSDDSTYVRSPRCPQVINQVGGQRPTYVCTYLRTYVAAHVRVVRAGLMLRTHRNRYMRTRERTYVRTFPRAYVRTYARTHVRTYVRILPEAPGGAEWYVRAYYRARAAKHHGKYVLTVSFTYVRTYVRTYLRTYVRT